VTIGAVADLAELLLSPAHFFTGPGLSLQWQRATEEEVSWEVFHSRLLDPAHTRERRQFTAWNIYASGPGGRSDEPLLSVKLDAGEGRLHIVRALECHVWEGYEAGGNTILSRERRKWVRELVGTIELRRMSDRDELTDELACLLFLAVVGASKLPLSSLEAPLPAFSFGELFYCYRPGTGRDDGPTTDWQQLPARMLHPAATRRERARLLEVFLRATPAAETLSAASTWAGEWSAHSGTPRELAGLLRTVFNEVSLSPWTDFVDKALVFVRGLEQQGFFDPATAFDFLSHLLRQSTRHLTAYDLVTFHHRGANYPDALLLDAVLKEYLRAVEQTPTLFASEAGDDEAVGCAKRLRRRALRQAYLLRRRYEGHPVPDLSTSPGENSRVLPPDHPRVPEEQILQPHRRTRRLFADDPLPRHVGPQAAALLHASFADLAHPEELRELGMGLFIDRPFAAGKHPAELDCTSLLSSLAFSHTVAEERLRSLASEVGVDPIGPDVEGLRRGLDVAGLRLDAIGAAARMGSVTLADARRASPDFVFLRTTAGSVAEFLGLFDLAALAGRFDLRYLLDGRPVLFARSPEGPGVRVLDERLRPRLELEVAADERFVTRAGQEYPAEGLLAVCVWEERAGELHSVDLRDSPVRVRPRER
jgi:hypothetical protein